MICGVPEPQTHLIRPARPQDAPHIATIKIESWCSAYSHILKPETLANLDHIQETEQFLQRITNQEHILVATDSQNHPLAYSLWIHFPPLRFNGEGDQGGEVNQSKSLATLIQTDWPHRNMLASLYVHPDHTGHGLGTALIRANAQLAHNRHQKGMMIGVFSKSVRAKALYIKLGAQFFKTTTFTVDGTAYPDEILTFNDLPKLINS